MNVFRAAADAWERGERAALATVLSAMGSTPRSAGARMLVHADGRQVGTIGGGALEHHVAQVALRVAVSGVPERVDVHLVRDLGMCCGGRTEVFVEPVGGDPPAGEAACGRASTSRTAEGQRADANGSGGRCNRLSGGHRRGLTAKRGGFGGAGPSEDLRAGHDR